MSRLPSQEFVTDRSLQVHIGDSTIPLPPNFSPSSEQNEGVSFSFTDLPVTEAPQGSLRTALVGGRRIGLPKNFTPSAGQPEGVSISDFDAETGGTFGERLVRSFQPRLPASPVMQVATEALERELQSPILESVDETGRGRTILRGSLDKAISVFDLPPARASRESGIIDTAQAALAGISIPDQIDANTWDQLRDKIDEEMKQYEVGDPRRDAASGIKAQLTANASIQREIESEAKSRGLSPEAQLLSQQAREVGMSTLPLPARATVTGLSETGLRVGSRLTSRLVGTTDRSRDINNSLQLQQELSQAYAKNSGFADVVGEGGAVILDQLLQSVPKYVAAGALAGPAGPLVMVGAESYDRRLFEAGNLSRAERQTYAVFGTAAELALMRIFAVVAGGTAEEALTPAARNAARQLLKNHGFDAVLKRGAVVAVAEGGEEASIAGSDLAFQVGFGLRKDFTGAGENIGAAAVLGTLGGAMAHTGAGVVSSLEGLRPKVKHTVAGYTAAGEWFQNASESDVKTVLEAQTDEDFGRVSGHAKESPIFRGAFVDEVSRLNELKNAGTAKIKEPFIGPLTKEEAADLAALAPASDASAPPSQSKITARQRDVRKFREALSFRDLSENAKRTFLGTLDEARNEGIPDRAWGMSLDNLIEMRPMSGKETIGVFDRLLSANDEYLALAAAKNAQTNEAFSEVDSQMQLLEQEMDTISEALIRTGSEQGFALAARQMRSNINRYAPSELRERAKREKKGPKKKPGERATKEKAELTDKQSKKVRDLSTKIAEAEKKVATLSPGTREWLDAMWEVQQLRNGANVYIASLRPSSTIKLSSVFGVQNLWRAYLTAFDGPAFLRHGYVDFVQRFNAPGAVIGGLVRAAGGGKGKLEQGKFATPRSEAKERTSKIGKAVSGVSNTARGVSFTTRSAVRAAPAIAANTARAIFRVPPIRLWPKKSTRDFFAAFASAKKVFEADVELSRHPLADLAKRHKLAIMADDAPLTKRDDVLISSAADKFPILKNFQRSFRVWINRVRMEAFADMIERFGGRGNLDPSTMWHIAQYVNSATGRGGLGAFENSANGLAQIFLAPRFFMSRITHGLGLPALRAAYQGDRVAAGIIAGEYANFLLGVSSFVTMAVLFGKLQFDEDNVDFEARPSEPNFGRLRIGDRQIDITGGLTRSYRLINTIGRGAYSTVTGDKTVLQKDTGRALAGTFTSSFAPGMSLASGLVLDKTFDGNFSPNNVFQNHFLPFSPRDAVVALQEKSDLSEGSAIALLEMFGGGGFQIRGPGR